MSIEIVPMTIREANEFVANYHRHNKPTQGGKFAIGISDGNKLCGVAIVGRTIARKLSDTYTAEVLRTCTMPDSPKGCVSSLYAACWRVWRDMGGKRLITYTLKTESGSSLRGAGWKVIAECKPGNWSVPSRHREWQPIYGQQKLRWEKSR